MDEKETPSARLRQAQPVGSHRILIVDDEPDMCWTLENILGTAGYAVTTTTTGAETLALLAGEPYAVAFVDAKLPDLDGLELAALIRQRSPHTAIILISGYFYQQDRTITEGLEKGLFIDFVSKPFDLDEVRLMAHQAVAFGPEGLQARRERARKGSNNDGPNFGGGR